MNLKPEEVKELYMHAVPNHQQNERPKNMHERLGRGEGPKQLASFRGHQPRSN